jgi:Cu/Ag efflux pump CusA
VKTIVARSGSDELGLDPMGLNQTDTFLVLKPRDEWRKPDKDWLADQLRAVMDNFPASRSPSPSPSTCASPRCSPACAATWRSSSSAPTCPP